MTNSKGQTQGTIQRMYETFKSPKMYRLKLEGNIILSTKAFYNEHIDQLTIEKYNATRKRLTCYSPMVSLSQADTPTATLMAKPLTSLLINLSIWRLTLSTTQNTGNLCTQCKWVDVYSALKSC